MYGLVPSRIHPVEWVTKTIAVILLTSNFYFSFLIWKILRIEINKRCLVVPRDYQGYKDVQ